MKYGVWSPPDGLVYCDLAESRLCMDGVRDEDRKFETDDVNAAFQYNELLIKYYSDKEYSRSWTFEVREKE